MLHGTYVLAVDLGTSGPKVALVDLRGQIVASNTQKTEILFAADGGVEQSPAEWWRAVCKGVHEVLAIRPELRQAIVGLCCTSQWSGTVAIDKNGQELMNSIIWMDARGAPFIRKLMQGLIKVDGYGLAKLLRWIYKTGGAPGQSGKDSLAHILYIKHKLPELYENTYKFLEPKDYLNFKFTGEIATSYDTIALHWLTNNRNLREVSYDPELIRQCGLSEEKFPVLRKATDTLGVLRPSLCREFGLKLGTKLIIGSPDIQSAAVGSGAVEDFHAHLYIGTSSWLTCHVPFKKTDFKSKMATLPSALPERYFIANEQESAGICLDYLCDQLLNGMRKKAKGDAQGQAAQETYDFAWLDQMAAKSPAGCRDIIFTPWLNGERTPVENHYLRGGFHNLSLHNRSEDFIRSVYEGVAYNSRWLMKSVERFMGRKITSLHMIGGGALSDLWCQIHADILGCTIKQVENPRHANTRGAAWIAAIGLGLMDLKDIAGLISIKQQFEPTPEHVNFYRQRFSDFLAIYESNKKIYKRLNKRLASSN